MINRYDLRDGREKHVVDIFLRRSPSKQIKKDNKAFLHFKLCGFHGVFLAFPACVCAPLRAEARAVEGCRIGIHKATFGLPRLSKNVNTSNGIKRRVSKQNEYYQISCEGNLDESLKRRASTHLDSGLGTMIICDGEFLRRGGLIKAAGDGC